MKYDERDMRKQEERKTVKGRNPWMKTSLRKSRSWEFSAIFIEMFFYQSSGEIKIDKICRHTVRFSALMLA